MNTGFQIGAVAAAMVFGFSVTTTGIEYTHTEPRHLQLELLRYNDNGTVTQQLSGGVSANWAAQIIRLDGNVEGVLCSGGGRGPIYNGETRTFTTNDWTFDECPALQPGDIGTASWEYTNDNNTPVIVIGRFVVSE